MEETVVSSGDEGVAASWKVIPTTSQSIPLRTLKATLLTKWLSDMKDKADCSLQIL